MDHCVKWLVYGFLVCLYKKSNASGDRTCCSNEVISGDSLGLKIISTIRNDKVPLKICRKNGKLATETSD
jgi:hypothetical protein